MTTAPEARRRRHPRPKTTESETPTLHKSLDSCPAKREPGPEDSSLHSSAGESVTFRDLAARVLRYWVPPRPLADPPPSLVQLWEYALRGEWTGQRAGPLRRLMAIYIFAIVFPVLIVLRYAEWILVRPGRLAVLIVLILLAIWS